MCKCLCSCLGEALCLRAQGSKEPSSFLSASEEASPGRWRFLVCLVFSFCQGDALCREAQCSKQLICPSLLMTADVVTGIPSRRPFPFPIAIAFFFLAGTSQPASRQAPSFLLLSVVSTPFQDKKGECY